MLNIFDSEFGAGAMLKQRKRRQIRAGMNGSSVSEAMDGEALLLESRTDSRSGALPLVPANTVSLSGVLQHASGTGLR